jgi:glycosyltransferase involved in cell wall biosynthesis
MHQTLRILLVVDLPWDGRLGASRVFMELAEAWRAQGHHVSKYCLTDAYPAGPTSGFLSTWRQLRFPRKAAAFVRRNHDSFDVIDALIGTMPYSKKRLRFKGLLVARSVGFYRLYRDFEEMARQRWPEKPQGKFFGRIFYTFIKRRMFQASERAVRQSDLVNFPNEAEMHDLRDHVDPNKPAVVQPYGLTDEKRRAFRQAAAPAQQRLAKKKICFIGTWDIRKGAKDWGEIVRLVRARVPDARFVFLGTLTADDNVLRDLGQPGEHVEIVRQFQPDQLPKLLADCAAGAFPSYAEGFGFGLLEQLAAAIPTVAYDAPGPRAILKKTLPELLVPAGDVQKFADALASILRREQIGYQKLAEQSFETARQFDWSTIAQETSRSYAAHLAPHA